MAENQREKRGKLFRKAVESLSLDSPTTEISDRLGYDKGNLSKVLNNKIQPSTTLIKEFEKAYGIRITDFEKEVNEKTPPKEARFEDIVAEKVLETLTPSLNSYTEEVIRAIGNLHIELNLLRQKMAKVEEMQKDCNKIQVETFDFIKHK